MTRKTVASEVGDELVDLGKTVGCQSHGCHEPPELTELVGGQSPSDSSVEKVPDDRIRSLLIRPHGRHDVPSDETRGNLDLGVVSVVAGDLEYRSVISVDRRPTDLDVVMLEQVN